MYIDKYIVILCILYIYIFYAFSCFPSSLLLYPIEFLVSLNFEFHWFIAIVIQPIIFEIRVFGVPQRHLLYRACFDKFRVSVVSTVKSRHRYKLRKKIIYFDEGREKIYFVR